MSRKDDDDDDENDNEGEGNVEEGKQQQQQQQKETSNIISTCSYSDTYIHNHFYNNDKNHANRLSINTKT